MSKKLSLKEFIQKAKQIHGNKYDYSLVDYKNNKTKIKIICPEHGIFEQTPNNHISKKYKCPKCKTLSTKEFINRAKQVHNNKYDYSLTDYKNKRTKVKIICPEHGIFEQLAEYHLSGSGCKKCSYIFGYTTKKFIDKAEQIHNNKYDYSLTNYINSRMKIKIICPKHGIFEQVAKDHLSGNGCPICNESKGEKAVAKYLDENNIQYIKQKRFNDCKNVKPLPFDFYIPKHNILIEYNGIQHYEAIEFFDDVKGLKYRQLNDTIKINYCVSNNIKLIIIKFNENIKNKLNFIINL